SYVGNDYLARTATEVDIPNVVTAVLASYRGYDTFGEVVVIFAAGLGVLLLLGLDGTSGRFRAQVSGQRLSGPSAPTGVRKGEGVEAKEDATKPRKRLRPTVTQYVPYEDDQGGAS
ncbi:MAG: hydrogen gas-evolving membrane-bound hydrogenase subunit E, partial [Pseudomonadota bacterium]